MNEYGFDEQLRKGEKYEAILDERFKAWFRIKPASKYDQNNGIDRIFTRKLDGCVFTVEYKADFQAHETGNVFIETVSVDRAGKRGWVLQTRAQIIAYYIVHDKRAHLLYGADMKTALPQWARQYREGSANNVDARRGNYASRGILVPIGEFTRYSFNTLTLNSWLA